MLKSLLIQDYAVIEAVNISFESGLNIITGETGAGKSIIIDAMSLILGERASSEVVRKNSAKAIIEAVFEVAKNPKVAKFCGDNDLDFLDEMIIRREVSAKGNSRCFINDTPVSLTLLKTVGDYLVDLHGQHEHQTLLRKETHIEFLDEVAGNENLLGEYQEQLHVLQQLKSELNKLLERENEIKQKKDFYEFQLNEINRIDPQPEEDSAIEQELKILENAEKIIELTQETSDILYDGEMNAYQAVTKARAGITALVKYDDSFSASLDELKTIITLLNDVSSTLRDYRQRIDVDPERLEYLRARLTSLQLLKRKYGGSISSVLELRDRLADECSLSENYDQQIAEFRNRIAEAAKKCGLTASRLSDSRVKISPKTSGSILQSLDELGLKQARFEVRMGRSETSSDDNSSLPVNGKYFKASGYGIDDVEFFISANPGEDMKPLAKVASGGEISRVMLALKTVLAKNEKLPLLIFDEIDTGVSGRIAQKVGQALHGLAKFHQIIAITHLPQIAGLADCHFVVEKSVTEGRTSSTIRRIIDDEQIKEVAKLMSGEDLTAAAIQSAKELMLSKDIKSSAKK